MKPCCSAVRRCVIWVRTPAPDYASIERDFLGVDYSPPAHDLYAWRERCDLIAASTSTSMSSSTTTCSCTCDMPYLSIKVDLRYLPSFRDAHANADSRIDLPFRKIDVLNALWSPGVICMI